MEEELRRKTTNLYHVYTNDLDSDFTEECIHFQKHCADKEFSKFLRCDSLQDVYPNLDIAVRISLCIPATNFAGEFFLP
ncbi:hypothetical protein JTB14_033569 [Gonioctena quinquepunctata]|nr:hypothetical protein JTB14_033569 [Gonioctena quinquepunctata]